MPHMGSCVAKLHPGKGPMFAVRARAASHGRGGRPRAGQFAGSLGGKYDPLLTGGNPNDDNFSSTPAAGANESAGRVAAAAGAARSTRKADAQR